MTQQMHNDAIRLHRDVILRAKGLLNMYYLPEEIVQELNGQVIDQMEIRENIVDLKDINKWIENGLKCKKVKDQIFISGTDFKNWVEMNKRMRRNM